MGKPWTDLHGRRFGKLTVLGIAGRTPFGKMRWLCRCDCGTEKSVAAADLCKKGRGTKSCGCANGNPGTHQMSRHPAYAVWRSVLARCLRPSHYAFHNYGGRGIDVCPRWQESFQNFWTDMGPTYQHGLTLDRIDNDRGYSPENCRWTDRRTQAMNKRGARFVNYLGERLNISEAARRSGLGVTTLLYRIGNGWPEEELFRAADPKNRVR